MTGLVSISVEVDNDKIKNIVYQGIEDDEYLRNLLYTLYVAVDSKLHEDITLKKAKGYINPTILPSDD